MAEYQPMAEAEDAELPRPAAVFRHIRHQHRAPQGLPCKAWDMADTIAGCPVSHNDEEGFAAWLQSAEADGYVEALHDAAHFLGNPGHDIKEI